jgi:hypothetical protein
MNNKYTNVYGENIINPNSKQTMTTNTRLAEIEKVLQSGETIIINNKQIKELYNLISTITDVEIELDEEQLDKLITKS